VYKVVVVERLAHQEIFGGQKQSQPNYEQLWTPSGTGECQLLILSSIKNIKEDLKLWRWGKAFSHESISNDSEPQNQFGAR
jgi:hypothetical protein